MMLMTGIIMMLLMTSIIMMLMTSIMMFLMTGITTVWTISLMTLLLVLQDKVLGRLAYLYTRRRQKSQQGLFGFWDMREHF